MSKQKTKRPQSKADAPSGRRQFLKQIGTGAAVATAAGSRRIVRPGDTLSRIASEITGGDTRSSRKWMVAIYRGNPIARAFCDIHAGRAHVANNPGVVGRNFGGVLLGAPNSDSFI